jgi:hypothetical protein
MRLATDLGRLGALVAFVISACGGKVQGGGDAGSSGRDATPPHDASLPPEDSAPPKDAALPTTCAEVCAHFAAEGCEESSCTSNCQELEVDCAGSGYLATFQELLDCAVTAAPIQCVNGNAQSTACASLTAAVAADCSAHSSDAGDFTCSTATSNVGCLQCCETEHPEGVSAYLGLLLPCECSEPGGCAAPCASEYCASSLTYPQPNDACDMCVAPSLGVGGNCWYAIFTGCGQDPGCLAMESCMATWCSNK